MFPLKVASEPEYECYDFSHFEVTVESEAVFEAERTVAVTHTDLYTLISQYDWNVEIARAVMLCESGGDARIVNDNPTTRDYSIGLFQINLYGSLAYDRPSEEWLKVPANNIEYAYTLYSQSGWKPWVNCGRKAGAF